MPDTKYNRLPVWARQELTVLENRVRELQAQVDAFNGKESRVAIRSGYGVDESVLFVPDYSRVQFLVDGNNKVEVTLREDGLNVRGYSAIRVLPNASNSVDVKLESSR